MSSLKSDYFFIDSLKKVKQEDWNACVDDDHPFMQLFMPQQSLGKRALYAFLGQGPIAAILTEKRLNNGLIHWDTFLWMMAVEITLVVSCCVIIILTRYLKKWLLFLKSPLICLRNPSKRTFTKNQIQTRIWQLLLVS